MSLRVKTVLIFSLILAVLVMALMFGMRFLLMGRLAATEELEVRANGERVRQAFSNQLDDLGAFLHIHSVRQPAERDIPAEVARSLRIGLMVQLDGAGRVIREQRYGSALRRSRSIAAELRPWLTPRLLRRLAAAPECSKGVVRLPDGLLLMAARRLPAAQTTHSGPGYLIVGRYLTQAELPHLAKLLHLPLQLLTDREFRQWRPRQAAVRVRNAHEIDGYAVLRDLEGRPAAVLRLIMSRTIYNQGRFSLYCFLGALLILGSALSLLVLAYLEKSVLSRLAFLNERAGQIAASSDLSIRIPISNMDELTSYATVFNRMMDSLEDSRRELERHREQLASANQRLVNIIDFLPDATFVIDCQGKVVAWNRAIEELTGIAKQDILGLGYYAYAFPFWGEPRPLLIDLVTANFSEIRRYYPSAELKGVILQAEVFIDRLRRGQGVYALISASPLYDHAGGLVGAIETVHDISNRKRAEEQLRYMGWHDQLTGLYNRTYFEAEVERFERGEYRQLGLVMCDVDGLKTVNGAGDKLLRVAAQLIAAAIDTHQIVARVGGDEFAILLPDCAPEEPQRIQDRIGALMEEHNRTTTEPKLSISLGWAISDDRKTIQEVFEEADNNMYRKKLHRIQSMHSNVIQILMKTLAARDFITEGHAERMKNLVQNLAEQVGLPERKVQDLRLLAEIHDIGKIGIADNILFKPGLLTMEEQLEIRRHSEIGQSIAESAQELSYLSDWILKHHEWWNGSGYPLGLKEQEIPLECRILAIADAFDAMTSDRPYRKAMPVEAALNELMKGAGTQFDPELAALFVRLVRQGRLQGGGAPA